MFFKFNVTKEESTKCNYYLYKRNKKEVDKHAFSLESNRDELTNIIFEDEIELLKNHLYNKLNLRKLYSIDLTSVTIFNNINKLDLLLDKNGRLQRNLFDKFCAFVYLCIKNKKVIPILDGKIPVVNQTQIDLCNDFIKYNYYYLKALQIQSGDYMYSFYEGCRKYIDKTHAYLDSILDNALSILDYDDESDWLVSTAYFTITIPTLILVKTGSALSFIPSIFSGIKQVISDISYGFKFYSDQMQATLDKIQYNSELRKSLGLKKLDDHAKAIQYLAHDMLSRQVSEGKICNDMMYQILSFKFKDIDEIVAVYKAGGKEIAKYEHKIIEENLIKKTKQGLVK